jgi:hypothetical protein
MAWTRAVFLSFRTGGAAMPEKMLMADGFLLLSSAQVVSLLIEYHGAMKRTDPVLEPAMPPPSEEWKWLSPTEEAIVSAASATEWKSTDRLIADARLPRDHDLPGILRNMIERNILESQPGRGYRLKNPPCQGQAP